MNFDRQNYPRNLISLRDLKNAMIPPFLIQPRIVLFLEYFRFPFFHRFVVVQHTDPRFDGGRCRDRGETYPRQSLPNRPQEMHPGGSFPRRNPGTTTRRGEAGVGYLSH